MISIKANELAFNELPKIKINLFIEALASLISIILIRATIFCQIIFDVEHTNISSSDISKLTTFMTRYGYILQSDLEARNVRDSKQFSEAIKQMQQFGNIPVTGVIDNATLALLERKRCGLPDILNDENISELIRKKRYDLYYTKWDRKNLFWSVLNYTKDFSAEKQFRIFTKAFKLWSDASDLTIKYRKNHRKADLVISFYPGNHSCYYPFDAKGAILAHAYFPKTARAGEIHFDDGEDWLDELKYEFGEGIQLYGTTAHEIGHTLGLRHSKVYDALMFPYEKPIPDDYILPYDDTLGIRKLYGPNIALKPFTQQGFTPPPIPTRPTDFTDTCNTSFDAVTELRNEILFFKGKVRKIGKLCSQIYFWRLFANMFLERNIPVEIKMLFDRLPENFSGVDAAYMRPNDREIVFFAGSNYFVYNIDGPKSVFPRHLASLGFASDVQKIDAAMVWGYNNRTYFFKGAKYWRFNEELFKVESDYPRDIAVWKGVPAHVDAAFTYRRNVFISNTTIETVFRRVNSDHYEYRHMSPHTNIKRSVAVKEELLFTNYLAFWILGTIWILCFLFIAVIFMFFSEHHLKIDEIYDGCIASTAYYKYLIKLKFGYHSKWFKSNKAFVMMDLMDSRKLFITRIAIPPEWMATQRCTYIRTKFFKHVKVVMLHVNRFSPLPEIGFIRIAHDSFIPIGQVLQVLVVEIKDLMANTLTSIPIFADIEALGPDRDAKEQVFQALPPISVKQSEEDLNLEGITPFINFAEHSLFFFFYINLNSFFTLFIPNALEFRSAIDVIVNAVCSSFLTFLASLAILLCYRKFVKHYYALNRGIGAWNVIRWIFLIALFSIAAIFGFTSALVLTAAKKTFIKHWIIANALVFVLIVFIYVPSLFVIVYKSGLPVPGKKRYSEGEQIDALIPADFQKKLQSSESKIETLEQMPTERPLVASISQQLLLNKNIGSEPILSQISKLMVQARSKSSLTESKTKQKASKSTFTSRMGEQKMIEEPIAEIQKQSKLSQLKPKQQLIKSNDDVKDTKDQAKLQVSSKQLSLTKLSNKVSGEKAK
ncbi:Matrix metalloproteinase-16-like protein [Dinothrombium tinctorium]|uniref:Matrix metalloproteinase-16-like protein n=1 Tax=Dinothrombium tinctorium TaxID=1965070 RepID=A0A3S3SPS9_9ACAR|nr:Matrix metalloproteinase-16-like protein [Dinothrombium tinctorium]